MRKLLVLLIKFIPIIQMIGMLINNTLCYYELYNYTYYNYILDFIFGNSIVTTILLLICSKVFKFCKWHKLIIIANFINIIIATYDNINIIPINDFELLCTYYIVASVFIIIGTYIHIKYEC